MADRIIRALAVLIIRVSDAVEAERREAPVRARRVATAEQTIAYIERVRNHG